MTTIKTFIKRHPVLIYFVLAFALSWGGVLIVVGPGGIPSTTAQAETLLPLVVLATDEAAYINGRTFLVGGGDIGIFREREVRSSIHKDGTWALDELINVIPRSLAKGLVSPVSPQPPQG